MRHGLGWEWRLYRVLTGGDDPAREASEWYEELIGAVDSWTAELHRTMLLAESGDGERVREAVARWRAGSRSEQRMARWVEAAYAGAAPDSA